MAHERRATKRRPRTKYAWCHIARRAVAASPAPVIGLLLCSASALAAFPGENGRIAYGYESDYSLEQTRAEDALITVQPNGMDARPLRRCLQREGKAPEGDCSSATYRSPAYSPDGAWLAFDAGVALALMYSDGSGLRFLSQATSDDGEPAWSPTGRRVVFTGVPAAGETDLWVRSIGSDESRRLTDGGGRQPAWSSRNLIAFTRREDIYTIRPDGSGLRRVTRRGGSAPAWSPRGDRLAFVRQGSIYVVRANGRKPRRLQLPPASGGLAWSPDGKRIAFENSDCFEGGIFVTRVDGRAKHVTTLAGNWCREFGLIAATDPDWQPLR